jgi:hypothetical protein
MNKTTGMQTEYSPFRRILSHEIATRLIAGLFDPREKKRKSQKKSTKKKEKENEQDNRNTNRVQLI